MSFDNKCRSDKVTLRSRIGHPSDTAATDDTGEWSLIALMKRLLSTDGGGGGGGASTIADGADVTEGAIADAAVTAGATGTVSAKLRSISRDVGSVTETAPASDTASSGLNGRLQRIAQRLTSLLAGTPILPVNLAITQGSISAVNGDIVASMDANAYRVGFLQLNGTFVATIQAQIQLDGSNWLPIRAKNTGSSAVSTNMSTSGVIYQFAIPPHAGFRIRVTAYTSGTVVGDTRLSSLPMNDIDANVSNLPAVSLSTSGGTAATLGGFPNNDAVTLTGFTALAVTAPQQIFNGTTWDRGRGMTANTVLTSAARTATVSTDVTNYNGRSFAVILNITAAPNTASTLTIQIRVKDSISGNYVTLLASAAIVGTATTGVVPVTNRYVVALGATVAANLAASDALGRTMNVNVVHSNGDSWTYSVSVDIGV